MLLNEPSVVNFLFDVLCSSSVRSAAIFLIPPKIGFLTSKFELLFDEFRNFDEVVMNKASSNIVDSLEINDAGSHRRAGANRRIPSF